MSKDIYDILIVGAGTSGMTCAITAAQKGARVLVLEKDSRIGGTFHWTGGHMSGGGTRRQKELGIEDSPDQHYEDIMRICEGSGDLDLIRMAVDEAPHTIDWLDDLGFEWAPECPRIIYGHIPYKTARTHYGTEMGYSFLKVLMPLWEKEVLARRISFHLNKPMDALINEGNKIVGVKAGTEHYYAKNIVLTTGGYGADGEFFAQMHPEAAPLVSATNTHSTGDGQKIVVAAGGQMRYQETHVPSLGGIEMEKGSQRADFKQAWAMVLTSVYRQPREIYLNAEGKRFMAEDEANPDTRERSVGKQSGQKFWMIFDEAALSETNEEGVENPLIIGWNAERIRAEAAREVSLWKADSLEELALKSGLEAEALKESVKRFNQQVAANQDEDFGRTYLKNPIKEGPFYALLSYASVLVTFAGLEVNKELQVLDEKGNPFPGLYAAGEILGLGATSGKAFCSGMAITPALSFGRILGRNLS
ncbi:MAG: FAD-dependent oxidoreductase [Bacteroidota bacterium]